MASKRPTLQDRENNIKKARPINALFGMNSEPEPVTEPVKAKPEHKSDKKKTTLIRQTYHMEPAVVEAIRIMDFESREGISSILNRILRENIDKDIMEQAENNILRRVANP